MKTFIAAASVCALLLALTVAQSDHLETAAVDDDDECLADDTQCGMSLLQLRGKQVDASGEESSSSVSLQVGAHQNQSVTEGTGYFQACLDGLCKHIPTGTKRYTSGPTIGDTCDTLFWTGHWPLDTVKVHWWSNLGHNHKIALFRKDYCTGEPLMVLDAVKHRGDGHGWHSVGHHIRSVRPYNAAFKISDQDGVGIKVVFFPNTGMWPYDQFSCSSTLHPGCSKYNKWCDQGLQHHHSPLGGPSGKCASGDDRIFCIKPGRYGGKHIITNGKPTPKGGGMDFAGYSCAGHRHNEYLCSFKDYPIGSVYVGLYYSNWGGGRCGADFKDHMKHFCSSGEQNKAAARGMCLWMRFWKSDVRGPGEASPHWDQYPFAQIVKPLSHLCKHDGGINFNICSPPAGQDLISGDLDFKWCSSPTKKCSQYSTHCSSSWPMYTEFFYVKILDCPPR
mmetsp:Transcript_36149/g.90979  ORF Transcript_36149/g.90979 Transcript_36149/m.90979 type:complete len:448 (-) Transcript_36149:8-1351(-)